MAATHPGQQQSPLPEAERGALTAARSRCCPTAAPLQTLPYLSRPQPRLPRDDATARTRAEAAARSGGPHGASIGGQPGASPGTHPLPAPRAHLAWHHKLRQKKGAFLVLCSSVLTRRLARTNNVLRQGTCSKTSKDQTHRSMPPRSRLAARLQHLDHDELANVACGGAGRARGADEPHQPTTKSYAHRRTASRRAQPGASMGTT